MREEAVVVIPVKALARAKGRLRTGSRRPVSELVAAMACDVAAAALAAELGPVVVMTADPVIAGLVGALGALVRQEPMPGRLNRSLELLDRELRSEAAGALLLVVPADCPAVQPADLAALAEICGEAERPCFVCDSAGTGSTAIAAPARTTVRPRYGSNSRAHHLAAGWRELRGDPWARLSQDVDQWPDLAAAAALGVGERTAAWLTGQRYA